MARRRKMTLGDLAEDLGLGSYLPLVCKMAPNGKSVEGCSKMRRNTLVKAKRGYVTLLAYDRDRAVSQSEKAVAARAAGAARLNALRPKGKGKKGYGPIPRGPKAQEREGRKGRIIRRALTTVFARKAAAAARGGPKGPGVTLHRAAQKACGGKGLKGNSFKTCVSQYKSERKRSGITPSSWA